MLNKINSISEKLAETVSCLNEIPQPRQEWLTTCECMLAPLALSGWSNTLIYANSKHLIKLSSVYKTSSSQRFSDTESYCSKFQHALTQVSSSIKYPRQSPQHLGSPKVLFFRCSHLLRARWELCKSGQLLSGTALLAFWLWFTLQWAPCHIKHHSCHRNTRFFRFLCLFL